MQLPLDSILAKKLLLLLVLVYSLGLITYKTGRKAEGLLVHERCRGVFELAIEGKSQSVSWMDCFEYLTKH